MMHHVPQAGLTALASAGRVTRTLNITMKTVLWLAALVLALPLRSVAQQGHDKAPTLDCSTGPVSKSYGATPWLVYACSDGKSIVAVTASGSPAGPFYFMLYPKDGKYAVVGEGTGPKNLTDRAYAELTRLTGQDVAELIASAKGKNVSGGKQ